MKIDLQLHSTYSDGYLSPSDAARFAADQGVRVAALTDHNTVGGLREFTDACRARRIKPVPGLELYAKDKRRHFNLLWYNFDQDSPELHQLLRDSQRRRRQQARTALLGLRRRGFRLDIDRVLDRYDHYVPLNKLVDELMAHTVNRARIQRELQHKEPRENDIIHEYFQPRRGYVLKNSNIDFERILQLRKKIGGQLVLCHPAKHHYVKRDQVCALAKRGLDGIEVLSPHHSYEAIVYLQAIARECGLIETGGSDFHRAEGQGPIERSWQYFTVDSELLRGIEKVVGGK